MVLVSPDFPGEMSGYGFALPRVMARLTGRKVRRAELSRWEAYGTGLLVFGISVIFAARFILSLVRPFALQLVALLLLPFAIWIAFLLLFYVDSLVVALLRKLGLYSAVTNNPFQHFVIISLITLLAALLVRGETGWIRSLGGFWIALVALNLLSIFLLKLFHER
jgi:hypothetical protein